MTSADATPTLKARLLQAAQDCFLSDDYHSVSTRLIAERAGANAWPS